MHTNPLVSVIIPNYNYACFLDERIRSILNQTYQNFELIILDDQSTDNSLEIIDKYKDNPHVTQIVLNENNSGSPFVQWNKGMNIAKGDLIWIAESDDYSSNTFLSRMVECFQNENVVMAFCHSRTISGIDVEIHNYWQSKLQENFIMSGKLFIEKYLIHSCVVLNASSAVFSKKVALDVSKEYTTFKGAGDWLFWFEMAVKGDVAYIHEKLNSCRFHEKNTTAQENKNGNSYIEIKRVYDSLLRQNIINERLYQKKRKDILYGLYYGTLYGGNITYEKRLLLMQEWGMHKCLIPYLFLRKCVVYFRCKFARWTSSINETAKT